MGLSRKRGAPKGAHYGPTCLAIAKPRFHLTKAPREDLMSQPTGKEVSESSRQTSAATVAPRRSYSQRSSTTATRAAGIARCRQT
jgi:hypothetical protein